MPMDAFDIGGTGFKGRISPRTGEPALRGKAYITEGEFATEGLTVSTVPGKMTV